MIKEKEAKNSGYKGNFVLKGFFNKRHCFLYFFPILGIKKVITELIIEKNQCIWLF